MALSPSHRFGQIIGNVLEKGLFPHLQNFATAHGLYLDRKGTRGCRNGTKCSWADTNGNTHDLDFVLERGGTDSMLGVPVAFIETAWRRYTKHSRNKVQEIQGAIEPLAQAYQHCKPFKGAILAGEFTAGALTQLRSLGFTVVHIPYTTIIDCFQKYRIDASYHESTTDSAFSQKVVKYEGLSKKRKSALAAQFIDSRGDEFQYFLEKLESSVTRRIARIIILVLRGHSQSAANVPDAIHFIEQHALQLPGDIQRFEIEISYANGDTIKGNFHDKLSAIQFLNAYQT